MKGALTSFKAEIHEELARRRTELRAREIQRKEGAT